MGNLLMDNLTKLPFNYPLSIDEVDLPLLTQRQIRLDVLRLDKIHPVISGNKWFKLKGWLRLATGSTVRHIVTFGGAWSNHIIAAACAGQAAGLRTSGIIRGEKPARLSDTLLAASGYGMELEFISRALYRQKDDPAFLRELSDRYPGAIIIPEGGAGAPGIAGSQEILDAVDKSRYSHILCAVGTGTMFRGLVAAAAPGQPVLGIAVLKGFQDLPGSDSPSSTAGPDGSFLAPPPANEAPPHRIIPDYHFGGYARQTDALLDFMNEFHQTTGIPSDFVYTGKLFYATLDLIGSNLFPPHSSLLVIHSGGLQGNQSLPGGRLHF